MRTKEELIKKIREIKRGEFNLISIRKMDKVLTELISLEEAEK